jgi:squalene-hopene/tetraprenyl-beta-curcumene cyclase
VIRYLTLVGVCVAASAAIGAGAVSAHVSRYPSGWDARGAAAYLDARQAWWESWPRAARDHGTRCVSCHTALPYALARPGLRATLHETAASAAERKLVDDVRTRVNAWRDTRPYYGDTTQSGVLKARQSRGTESVLNALVLSARGEAFGVTDGDRRRAFDNMFALQLTDGGDAGAWPWLDFDLEPWEASTATYFGAALAAIAVAAAPRDYIETPEAASHVASLRTYLRSHVDASIWARMLRRDDASGMNQAMALWVSGALRGTFSREQQLAMTAALFNLQQAEGCWGLGTLGHWRPRNRTSLVTAACDGYATGLVAYALERAGESADEPHLARALSWLAAHQDAATGAWHAASLNKDREAASDVGKFMSDAASAFAVLALTSAER